MIGLFAAASLGGWVSCCLGDDPNDIQIQYCGGKTARNQQNWFSVMSGESMGGPALDTGSCYSPVLLTQAYLAPVL